MPDSIGARDADFMVELSGIEPLASSLRIQRKKLDRETLDDTQ
jgi:hypothetical protein